MQVPGLGEDFGADAAAFLAQLAGNGKRFNATVVRRERGLGAREKHPRKAADKLHVSTRLEAAAAGGGRLVGCWPGFALLDTHKVGLHCMFQVSVSFFDAKCDFSEGMQ